MKESASSWATPVFVLVLCMVRILTVGCSHVPPSSESTNYVEGLDWGRKLANGEVKDYELVCFMDESLTQHEREGFMSGFAEGYKQSGVDMFAALFDAVDSDEFREGRRSGKMLCEGNISDELVRDVMVGNQIKSRAKQSAWRCGFIIGYRDARCTCAEGEAVYRSIESSISRGSSEADPRIQIPSSR